MTYLFVVFADGVQPFEDFPGVLWHHILVNDCEVLLVLHVEKSTCSKFRLASASCTPVSPSSFGTWWLRGADPLVQRTQISIFHPSVGIGLFGSRQILRSNDSIGEWVSCLSMEA